MQLLSLLREIVIEPQYDVNRKLRLVRQRAARQSWYKEVFTPAVNEYLSEVSNIMGQKYTFRDGINNGISVKYWFSRGGATVSRAMEYIQANPEIKVDDTIIKVKGKVLNGDLRVLFMSDKIDRSADKLASRVEKEFETKSLP